MSNRMVFKYMSIKDLKRFFDIVYYSEIYAPTIEKLNDIKEGSLRFDKAIPQKERSTFVKRIKENVHICSFTTLENNGHMFAVYGDCHKGCCIKLHVTAKSWKELVVHYQENVPIVISVDDNAIEEIMKIKSSQWGDEKEIRYFKLKKDSDKLKVKIEKVYFGVKVTNKDYDMYKHIIQAIDPHIEVAHLKEKDIDFGFSDE